jgi:hypothetical protein
VNFVKKLENKADYLPLSELVKLENNPRTIKKADFEKLKESIKSNPDYFEARPIICSDRTGQNVILGGNQRYEAAKALGMSEVPVIVLHGLDEAREREIVIRDNVNNGDWDFDILANEWDEKKLQEWGVDNIKTSIKDEKEIENDPPTITASFITVDYSDEIELQITEETAEKLMAEMIQYRNNHGSYDGFWDERLHG